MHVMHLMSLSFYMCKMQSYDCMNLIGSRESVFRTSVHTVQICANDIDFSLAQTIIINYQFFHAFIQLQVYDIFNYRLKCTVSV